MKNILFACFTLGACFAVLGANDLDDSKAIQGSWMPVAEELAGQPLPPPVLKAITLKLTKTDYDVTVTGEQPDHGTWTIEPGAKPKGMKIVGVKGPNAGKTIPAIYEINSDTLRICYDLSGAKRPANFKTLPGTRLYLATYKRVK